MSAFVVSYRVCSASEKKKLQGVYNKQGNCCWDLLGKMSVILLQWMSNWPDWMLTGKLSVAAALVLKYNSAISTCLFFPWWWPTLHWWKEQAEILVASQELGSWLRLALYYGSILAAVNYDKNDHACQSFMSSSDFFNLMQCLALTDGTLKKQGLVWLSLGHVLECQPLCSCSLQASDEEENIVVCICFLSSRWWAQG